MKQREEVESKPPVNVVDKHAMPGVRKSERTEDEVSMKLPYYWFCLPVS